MANKVPCLKTQRLTLRNIALEDTEDIVSWRSDPEVYQYFFSPRPIKAEDHINWFENRYLQDDNRYDWMALDDKDEPVGVFGLRKEETDAKEAEVSYILAPNKKGVGYAKEALQKLIEFAKDEWKCETVIAEIHKENQASIHFAKRLGMSIASVHDNFCVFRMSAAGLDKRYVYIRCDGNAQIGIGHVMRCLSIAKQVIKLGKEPVFLVADGAVESLITENGFKTICLHTSWEHMDSEIDLLERFLADSDANILVDSYYVTQEYFKSLSSFAHVTYLDDLCASKYEVQNLINYNYYAPDLGYEKVYGDRPVTFYLGSQYAPLRTEFEDKPVRSFRGIEKILITTGGTDQYNVLGYLLDYFISHDRDAELFAIVGRFNVNRELLFTTYGNNSKIHLLENVNNMQDYMMECDLCITAGGSTLYELCACGTPSLMYVLADNQLDAARKFNDTQIIPCLGDVRTELNRFAEYLDYWIEKYSQKDTWEMVSKRMRTVVDAKGAFRIAEILVSSKDMEEI